MKQRIRQILSQREKKCIADPDLTLSAVLVPIYEKAGEYYILFTKRTETVEYHKGQISFPGGRRDDGDSDLLATALREAFEEIGLRPEAVEILGELDEERTIGSNFMICPFIGFIPYPYQFEISRDEVEQLVEVPLSALLDKANFREEVVTDEGKTFPAYFYHYGDQVIWGATARILKRFLDLVYADGPYEIERRFASMSLSLEDLENQVLNLSLEARAHLAEKLILSLDAPSEEENLRLWVDEAEKRLKALREGKAKEIPAEEAFSRARAAIL